MAVGVTHPGHRWLLQLEPEAGWRAAGEVSWLRNAGVPTSIQLRDNARQSFPQNVHYIRR
jgi:hypothetical protein